MTGAADACYKAAREAWKVGLSPVPCGKPKQPVTAWKAMQRRRPTADQLREWYPGRDSLGIVCGPKPDDPDPQVAARPGVECIDFDVRETYNAVKAEAEHVGLADDIARIEDGYCDDTPGGGVRWLYRCAEVPGNLKLAQRLDADGHPFVTIETRGEGGFCVVAPSGATAHPSGRPYVRRSGNFTSLVTLSVQKRAQIIAFLMSFNEVMTVNSTPSSSSPSSDGGTRPGDAFNASTTWPAILEPHGWQALYTRRDGVTCWRRPGKNSPGLSATTGHGGGDLLYVFTSSSVFAAGRSYDKFGAFAVLEHGGDFGAAARALAARGLGTPTRASAESDAGDDDDHEVDEDHDDRKRPSMATQIVDLVQRSQVTLWHDGDSGDGYLTIQEQGHQETHPLRARVTRNWIARLVFRELEKVPNAQAVSDAIAVLEGKAQHDGDAHPVAVRVAAHDGHILLDLADEAWQVLDIGRDGWTVRADSPVRFRRGQNMRPLPMPVAGGRLDALRDLLNVEDDRAWVLLVGWLLGTLAPRGPYPVLALVGEQGTAKSSTARMLRRLVDPRKALLSRVRNFDDLAVSLRHQHVLGIDNLSSISAQLSDELAVIATGGGSEKRALYSDDDCHTIDVCKPIVLTSIPLVIQGGDLLERAVVVRCPTIPEQQRRTEAALEEAFTGLQPQILGALADAVAMALRQRASVRLPGLPRMADHCAWVTAAESALGWEPGTYYAAFTGQQHDAIHQQIADDPLALGLLAFTEAKGGEWSETTADLLAKITPEKPPKDWPRSARALSAQLDRLAPSLRRAGLHLTPPDRRTKARTWIGNRTTGTFGTTGTTDDFAQRIGRFHGAGLPAQPAPDRHQTGTDRLRPAGRPAPTGTTSERPAPQPAPAKPRITGQLRVAGPDGAGGAGLTGTSNVGTDQDDEVDHAANF